ncbi:putative disease resistance protein RGA4 isoform X2 [Typha latifolia]|uniref:putative disease resistance protein RGA4 isoform X2 n=1 Tax=Typha latifolia TaxID=4733 RepID=UPI003C2FB5D5
MAEAAALAGLGWVASPIVTKLLNEGFTYLSDEGCSCLGVNHRLENLETTILPQFQLVIEAAEKSVHKTKMERWLRRLKYALYEAEDTLDLYKYQLLKKKVSELNTHPALKPFKKVAQKVNDRLSILSSQKIKLRKSLNKLEKIAAEAKTFHELLRMQIEDGMATRDLMIGGQQNIPTSILPTQVFGRDEERDKIIDKCLLDQSEAGKNYSVVTITGIGGAGKTTLAQLIYNDQKVVDNFNMKMWVCVSRKLDIFRHTREMVESASNGKCHHFDNLDTLQKKLVDLIQSKKVLLVLDDVWCDKTVNQEEWENLLAPLATVGKKGSKILVTTRTKNSPVALHPQYSLSLRDLDENDIISIFMYHAFLGAKLSDLYLQKELEEIGKQIVQKLHRSPLAAKAVGGQLRKRLESNFWRAALDRNNLHNTQQALLWSYQRLDAPLQRCFLFLSLLPKGTIYEAENIVYLWMAEGFIYSSNNSTRLEEVGMNYFNELVSGSFLQLTEEDGIRYSMHDLFHDLAENISKEDYLRVEDDQVKEIPPSIRYLYVSDGSLWKNNTSFKKLENLRTLIFKSSNSSSAIDHLFAETEKYRKLRVLDLSLTSTETLPKSIGDLKHLRYLNFSWTKIAELPVELGKLYHLQVIINPYHAATFPRSVKNLINLRHFKDNDEALTRIPDIGRRLTSLQTLPEFHIKKEKGYDIGQLRNLNELRGSLRIENLENIEGKDKAVEANLKNKKHLESLELNWKEDDESDSRRDLDREVLEGLQPHSNLIELTINSYKSPEYPNWLLQQGCIQNLRSLKIEECTALEVLPPLSDLFPYIQSLRISSLPNLRKFSSLPSSLKELEIYDCGSLVFVSKEEVEERVEDISGRKEKIELILPSTLQSLKIWTCDITDRALSQSLERLTSLKSLELGNNETITTLPSEEILHHLVSLTHLQVAFCYSLESLGDLYVLPSLEELTFWDYDYLEGILPPSLRKLHFMVCKSMKSFVAGDLPNLNKLLLIDCTSLASLSLSPLTALTELKIIDCPGILSLPDHLPYSLMSIYISGCPVLEERCRSPNGEDWPKIAHIPNREIYINSVPFDRFTCISEACAGLCLCR